MSNSRSPQSSYSLPFKPHFPCFFIMLQNCLLHTAKCLKFHCVIFNLRRNHEATIRIRARYDSHSYVCLCGPVVTLNCKAYSSDYIRLLCIVYLAYFVKHATYFLSCSMFQKANQFWYVSDFFYCFSLLLEVIFCLSWTYQFP